LPKKENAWKYREIRDEPFSGREDDNRRENEKRKPQYCNSLTRWGEMRRDSAAWTPQEEKKTFVEKGR